MKWIIGILILLSAITMVAQAPDTHHASDIAPSMTSNSDVRYAIQSILDTSPEFNNTFIMVTVYDDSVVMNGYVYGFNDKQAVLKFAAQYAGGRRIVDQIRVGGSPGDGRR